MKVSMQFNWYQIKSIYDEKGKDWKRAMSTLAPTFIKQKRLKSNYIKSNLIYLIDMKLNQHTMKRGKTGRGQEAL